MALGAARLMTALTLLAVAACGDRAIERFAIDGRRYSVPAAHLVSGSREPHVFIRIKHPDRAYDLVFDSRLQGAQSGPGVPRLFSINDGDEAGVEYHDRPTSTVICRKAVPPNGGCGLRLDHAGVHWTVLFPASRLSEAESIEQDATRLLDRYAV